MSEKRFVLIEDDLEPLILDNKETMSVKEVVDKLNEQQATIRKLQDLCGKSDGENAKLRIENEQLRQQQQRLYNYFRDYLEDEVSAENFGEMWDLVIDDE